MYRAELQIGVFSLLNFHQSEQQQPSIRESALFPLLLLDVKQPKLSHFFVVNNKIETLLLLYEPS